MSSLMNKVKIKMRRYGAEGIVFSDEYSIRYITGFYFSGMMVVVGSKGRPACFVDAMNFSLAKGLLRENEEEIELIAGPAGRALAEFSRGRKIGELIYEDRDISVAGYEKLIKDLPGIKLIGSSGGPDILGNIRKIKDRKETDVMRRAARITVKIWKKIKKNITTGMTEKDIAAMIDMHIRSRGCLNAFPTIAAVGKNTAYPHAVPTSRRLKDNEHVLVDFGVRYKGYCSDLTRICLNGRIDRQIMGFRDHVRKAHDLAIKTAKDGVRIDTVCGKVRKVFQDANLGDFLLHGLGHGIGVEVHERPFLRLGCPEKLKKGMFITIEPGLYREGLGGVREEDMILITEKGCEVLTL